MKFKLDFSLDVADGSVPAADVLTKLDSIRPQLSDISATLGRIRILVDGDDVCGEYADPLVRLVDQWLRKLPWIIGGDTETVALRNSENCFAFVPASESVEFSYFLGSETEIEEYVVEPTTVRLDLFVAESLRLGDSLEATLRGLNEAWVTDNEDCRDLATSLSEAKRVWREYQLHQRR